MIVYVVRIPDNKLMSYVQGADTPAEAVAMAIAIANAPRVRDYHVYDWNGDLHKVALEDVDAFVRKTIGQIA
jgi:hypothetical protein